MRRVIVVMLCVLCTATVASAQRALEARVQSNAPIYVRSNPSDGTVPLRVASRGTVLRVLLDDGEWLQVQFQDPQWGLRTGWVQRALVAMSDPNLQPMDLSIQETAADTGDTGGRQQLTVAASTAPVQAAAQRQMPYPVDSSRPRMQVREGFWFNAGMGFGSLGCESCIGRENGLSGGLSLGGALGDKWLLGVGTTGWAKQLDGELLTVGTLDVRFRFYPTLRTGFFITGGLGLGSVSYAGDSEFGAGAIVGVGWDIRVGSNVSLTPFWNGFAMQNDNGDANVGQLGLGVTIH